MGHSCKKSLQLIMMIKLSILSILLFSLASSTPLPSKEQEDQVRGLLEDIIIGQIQNQINNLLGITTTRGTPILDLAGGILGVETTTAPPQESANLIQTLLGLLFPTTTPATTPTTTTPTTTTPTTTPTTTTDPPTTTKCGGLIGGGLLC